LQDSRNRKAAWFEKRNRENEAIQSPQSACTFLETFRVWLELKSEAMSLNI
jgi:hypothetical protein